MRRFLKFAGFTAVMGSIAAAAGIVTAYALNDAGLGILFEHDGEDCVRGHVPCGCDACDECECGDCDGCYMDRCGGAAYRDPGEILRECDGCRAPGGCRDDFEYSQHMQFRGDGDDGGCDADACECDPYDDYLAMMEAGYGVSCREPEIDPSENPTAVEAGLDDEADDVFFYDGDDDDGMDVESMPRADDVEL